MKPISGPVLFNSGVIMTEKIEVGYTPAAFVGGLGIFHKYIIYTDSNGDKFYARGGPGYFGPGAASGGRSESSTSPFGNIKTESGKYDDKSPDWDRARDPEHPDPNATPHPAKPSRKVTICRGNGTKSKKPSRASMTKTSPMTRGQATPTPP